MTPRNARVIGMCLSLLSVTAIAAERQFDKTLTVEPGGKLSVDADRGHVTVIGTDSGQVTMHEGDSGNVTGAGEGSAQVIVHITARGSDRWLDRLEMSADKTAEGVQVRVKYRNHSWRNSNTSRKNNFHGIQAIGQYGFKDPGLEFRHRNFRWRK